MRQKLLVMVAMVPIAWTSVWADPPKLGSLRRSALPEGTGWFCHDLAVDGFFDFSGCRRTEAACVEDQDKRMQLLEDRLEEDERSLIRRSPCTKQKTASVLTVLDLRNEAFVYLSSPEMATCRRERAAMLQNEDMALVSRCERIGGVAAHAPELERIPKGKGWYCFSVAAPNEVLGRCMRTETPCEQEREDFYARPGGDRAVDATCAKQARAFVFTTHNDWFATSSSVACEAARARADVRSTCRAIP